MGVGAGGVGVGVGAGGVGVGFGVSGEDAARPGLAGAAGADMPGAVPVGAMTGSAPGADSATGVPAEADVWAGRAGPT